MDGTQERKKLGAKKLLPETTSGALSESPATQLQKDECEKFLPCDPRQKLHRYMLFFGFMCMLMFGRYYSYDNPNALQSTFIKEMDFSRTQYNSLYLVYTWPNVIISAFGGFLLDRWFGIRIGTIIFCALVCIGQLIFALGGFLNTFWVMVLGRFIFGLGGETVAVATYSYMVIWFRINELNTAFGVLLSASRLASTLNQNISQRLYDAFRGTTKDYIRLGVVFMIGFGFCIISFLCALLLGLFDRRAEKIIKRERDSDEVVQEKITIKDRINLPLKLWLLIIICVIYYVTVDPFLGLAVKFFGYKYKLSSSEANFVSSLVYFISVAGCPIIGFLVDKIGFNLIWLNSGIILTFCAHTILALFPNYSFIPYIATSLMGIAYSMCAIAIWPLIALIVPEYQLGTAFGIMQAVQNFGLAVFIILAGTTVEKHGYLYLEIIFLIMLSLALIAGVILLLYDLNFGGTLNKSGCSRAKLHKVSEDIDGIGSVPEATDLDSGPKQSVLQLGRRAPYSHKQSLLVPRSDFHIRNRYLSKMGAKVPKHLSQSNL